MKNIGIGLILAGLIIMIGYAVFSLLSAADVPVTLRIAFVVLAAGFVLLLGALIRERIKDSKEEKNDHRKY